MRPVRKRLGPRIKDAEHHPNLELQLAEPPTAEAVEAQLIAALLKFWETSRSLPFKDSGASLDAWPSSDFPCVHQYQMYWIRRIENEWIASVVGGTTLTDATGSWNGSVRSLEPGCTDYADRVVFEWLLSTEAPIELDIHDVLFLSVKLNADEDDSACSAFPAVRPTREAESSVARNLVRYSAWIPRNALDRRGFLGAPCRLWRAFLDEREWRAGLVPFQRQFMAVTRLGQVHRPLLQVLMQPEHHFKRQRQLFDEADTILEPSSGTTADHTLGAWSAGSSLERLDSSVAPLNESQSQAVRSILKTRSGKVTLIVGPPGTGKTRVIVEALHRLVLEEPKPRVLVCAPSNQAVRLLFTQFRQRATTKSRLKTAWLQAQIQRQSPNGVSTEQHSIHQATAPEEESSVKEADIVFTTLNSAAALGLQGTGLMNERTFQYLIVDEASQAVEPDTLIPLILHSLLLDAHSPSGNTVTVSRSPGRLILVGDARQLPATVRSRWNQLGGYEKSLFERLFEAAERCRYAGLCWLREQYRMHPSIAAFPSYFFYSNRLATAPQERPRPPFDRLPIQLMDFSNEAQHREIRQGTSLANPFEANRLVAWLAEQFRHLNATDGHQWSVLLLTPYRAQVNCLEDALARFQLKPLSKSEASGVPNHFECRVSTIDGAQGSEADLVILSLVRSARRKGAMDRKIESRKIGFLADARRLNVALTRARSTLLVGGDLVTVARSSPLYAAWLSYLHHQSIVPKDDSLWARLKIACGGTEPSAIVITDSMDSAAAISQSPGGTAHAFDSFQPNSKERELSVDAPCPICRRVTARIAAAIAQRSVQHSKRDASPQGSPTARLSPVIAAGERLKIKRSQKDARSAAALAEEAASRLVQSDEESIASMKPAKRYRPNRSSRPHGHTPHRPGSYRHRTAPSLAERQGVRSWQPPGRRHPRHVSMMLGRSRLDARDVSMRDAFPSDPNGLSRFEHHHGPRLHDTLRDTQSDACLSRTHASLPSVPSSEQHGRATPSVFFGSMDRFRERPWAAHSVARHSTAVQRLAARLEHRHSDAVHGVTSRQHHEGQGAWTDPNPRTRTGSIARFSNDAGDASGGRSRPFLGAP